MFNQGRAQGLSFSEKRAQKCPAASTNSCFKVSARDFPGGPVVKNSPSSVGDSGSTPGRGTKTSRAKEQLSLSVVTAEPVRRNRRSPSHHSKDPAQPKQDFKKERREIPGDKGIFFCITDAQQSTSSHFDSKCIGPALRPQNFNLLRGKRLILSQNLGKSSMTLGGLA